MSNPPVIAPYEAIVAPEWIDYSGHMNVGYYLLVFEDAARHFFTLPQADSRSCALRRCQLRFR